MTPFHLNWIPTLGIDTHASSRAIAPASIVSLVVGASYALVGVQAVAASSAYSSGVVYEHLHVDYDIHADGTYEKTWDSTRLIETQQGAAKEGSYSIPFKDGAEEVTVLDAHVVTADGRTLPVGPQAIFLETPRSSPETATFSDVRSKTVVFPEAGPGSRLYLKYRLTNHRPDFAGVFSIVDWYSVHAKREDYVYRFKAPRSLGLHVEAQSMALSHRELGADEEWTAMGGVDRPIAPEAGSVAAIDYSPRVSASSLPDYRAFAATYARLTADSAKPTRAITELADRVTAGVTDPREQARRLYDWVAINIRYVGVQIGSGSWLARPADEVLANRYGDCKGHVVLLEALLQAKGIDSTGALLNAGTSWWMPGTAAPQAFNHIITYVPKLGLFLDSTSRFVAFGELPPDDGDKKVLLVASGDWVTTPPAGASSNRTTVEQALTIDSDGKLSGRSQAQLAGSSAAMARAIYTNLASTPDDQLVSALIRQDGESGSGRIARPDVERLTPTADVGLDFELSSRPLKGGAGELSLSRGVAFGGIHAFSRSVTDAPRTTPFVCPALAYAERTVTSLPPGLHVEALPAGVRLQPSDARLPITYESTYRLDGDKLVATRRLTIDPPHGACDAASYDGVRVAARKIEDDYASEVAYRR